MKYAQVLSASTFEPTHPPEVGTGYTVTSGYGK